MLDRFEKEFINSRRKELEKFLNRLVQEPKFVSNQDFKSFLTFSDINFNVYKSQSSKGFISSIFNIVSLPLANPTEIDEWFDQQVLYWQSVDNNFCILLSRSINLSKVHMKISQTWNEFLKICSNIASNEKDIDPVSSRTFRKYSEIATQLSSLESQLSENQIEFLDDNLKDWIRVIKSIREVFENRKQDLLDYQNATKAKQEKMEKLNKNPSSSSIQAEILDLESFENKTQNQYELTSNTIKTEVAKTLKLKTKEISVALRRLAQNRMNYHLTSASLWKELTMTIDS